MKIDPAEIEPRELYGYLVDAVVPRPIGWVGTTSAQGVDNLAPYSFFNAICSNPPAVMFSGTRSRDGRAKHSVTHALERGEFTLSIVSRDLAEAMNRTSVSASAGESEFDLAGLTRSKSERVVPPAVSEAAVRAECEVMHHFDVGQGPGSSTVVIGRILLMHVSDRVVREGRIAADLLDAVGRLGGESYATTRDRFELGRPG
jgi:flavin reductase (DIM6/NTAB) family NADH-FMN oxidoreductase RutF